jgi:hypothetical protein
MVNANQNTFFLLLFSPFQVNLDKISLKTNTLHIYRIIRVSFMIEVNYLAGIFLLDSNTSFVAPLSN